MHTAISCASCTRPLRIPADLLGQTVRCPFCTDAFTAVADPSLKIEETVLNRTNTLAVEAPQREAGVLALMESAEPEPPVVEEAFTVDLEGPVKKEPPKPWSTWVFVRKDSDRRLWGEMQAEISAEGVRLVRGRKELTVPVGCEATWVSGGLVRVVVGSRTVEFQIKKKHVYKSRLAADVAGFLNGDRPMPANKGYSWPWYQWMALLAPLALIGVLIAGELPETPLKPLKGFGIFMLAVLAPVFAYAVWHFERIPVMARWMAAGLLVVGAYAFSGSMYLFGPRLPPAAATANWTNFAPPGGGYRINMPAQTLTETESDQGMLITRTMARVKPSQMFTVAYADLDGSFNEEWQRSNALNRGQQYVYTLYPKAVMIGSSRPIAVDGFAGTEVNFSQGSSSYGRATITARIYLVGRRLYIVSTSETIGNNDRTFLDSFQVEMVPGRGEIPSPRDMDGLVAYWSFDQVTNKLVTDEKGGNPSALNECKWPITGVRGKGIEMTGAINSHIAYGDSPTLNFKDKAPFTIAGWFKTTTGNGVLVSQRNNNDRQTILNIALTNNQLTAQIHEDGTIGPPVELRSKGNVNDGMWHHFALVRDSDWGSVSLYLDNVEQMVRQEAAARGSITTNLRAFGCDLFAKNEWLETGFRGSMDEICIFNRRLTQKEINQLSGKIGP